MDSAVTANRSGFCFGPLAVSHLPDGATFASVISNQSASTRHFHTYNFCSLDIYFVLDHQEMLMCENHSRLKGSEHNQPSHVQTHLNPLLNVDLKDDGACCLNKIIVILKLNLLSVLEDH